MKHCTKKMISWVLALAMIAGLLPVFPSSAYAESMEGELVQTAPQPELQEQPEEVVLPASEEAVYEEAEVQPALEETVENAEAETESAPESFSEEAISAEPTFIWETMSDDAFFSFLQQNGHVPFLGNADAEQALLQRAQSIQDPVLREAAIILLDAWLHPVTEPSVSEDREEPVTEDQGEEPESSVETAEEVPTEEVPAEEIPTEDAEGSAEDSAESEESPIEVTTESTEEVDSVVPAETEPEAGESEESEELDETEVDTLEHPGDRVFAEEDAYGITLDELNGSDMFFKQEVRGTCTLAASAMLIRRSARILGNPNWVYVTESSLRPYAWIDGTGMMWNFTYAGITVGHTAVSNCTYANIAWMLQEHPEGFVAYNANKPHAVLITDITNGVVYCADPGLSGSRMPVDQAWLSQGSQDATIAGFTAFWYVTSPKLALDQSPSLNDVPMNLTVIDNHDGSVYLHWNNAGAYSYSVYRSTSKDGPWTEVYQANGTTTSWTDTTAKLLHTYYYTVRSFSADKNYGAVSEAVMCTLDPGGTRIAEGTCGADICWALFNDGMMLISGTGTMEDYASEGEEPWVNYRSQIKEVYISEGITSIGRSAFGGCPSLTRASIPASAAVIGDWAFRGCSSLSNVTIGKGVQKIGYAAFRQCDALQAISIPDSVTEIGDWAFSNCPALTRVVLSAGLSVIGNSVFYEDAALTTVTIPTTVKTIGDHAFRGCKALQLSQLSGQLQSIGKYAFAMCQGITSLDLSGCTGTLTLDEGAFYNCAYLRNLLLPTVSAGSNAFAYCYSLNHVRTFSTGPVTTFGPNAFLNCTRLGHVMTSGSVSADASAFSGDAAEILVDAMLNGGDFSRQDGSNMWYSYRMAGGVDGSYWFIVGTGCIVFYGGSAYAASEWLPLAPYLFSLRFENGIQGIQAKAFAGLTSIHDVYMPESAMNIDADAFNGITATVHYHNTNGSWTNVAGKNYGGTLTWQEEHTLTWSVSQKPTADTAGSLLGTCSVCKGTQTVELPKLDDVNYTISEEAGVSTYTWNITDYGTYSFELSLLTITQQPASAQFDLNAEASFTVKAEGDTLTYQWQWRAKETDEWTDCSTSTKGYNEPEVHPVASSTRNGYQYRCKITDANGTTVYSEIAVLTVQSEITIISQPTSIEAEVNSQPSFLVTASGDSLSYRWQWRASSDAAWTNCSSASVGYNTAELRPIATLGRNGYQYRCLITDRAGNKVYTDVATLKVVSGLQITAQPADAFVAPGAGAVFHVEAKGNGLTYRWQFCTPTSSGWTNCSSASVGYNTDTLKPVGTLGRNGYKYRCVITDNSGNKVTSSEAALTVEASMQIHTQPANQTVSLGEAANFTIAATGTGLKYQWQYKTPSATGWVNCSSATVGYRSSVLSPIATTGRNGYEYRCIVTDANGQKLTSQAAKLIVNTGVRITKQPSSVTAAVGSTAEFSVSATGSGLSYRWQYFTPSSSSWTNCSAVTTGYNANTLRPVATSGRNGYQYRCVITAADGTKLISNTVTLTVR